MVTTSSNRYGEVLGAAKCIPDDYITVCPRAGFGWYPDEKEFKDDEGLNSTWGIDCWFTFKLHESIHFQQCNAADINNDDDTDWLTNDQEIADDLNMNGQIDTEDGLKGIEVLYKNTTKTVGLNSIPNESEETFDRGDLGDGDGRITNKAVSGLVQCESNTPKSPSSRHYRQSRRGTALYRPGSVGSPYQIIHFANYQDCEHPAYCGMMAWSSGSKNDFDWGAPGRKFGYDFIY